jgi:hypothetical protein
MPRKTVRVLACFGLFLMVFLLAADVTARGRGGGGGGRGGGGFSRGGGGFNRGGGGLNRGGGSNTRRPSPNVSRRGPASGGTFGRDGERRDGGDRTKPRQQSVDPEQREEAKKRVDKRQKNRNEHYNDHDEYYEHRGYYGVGTTITVVTYDSLSCTPTSSMVGGVTYYSCGGTWYSRVYSGGSVNYLVVDPPAGH